MINMINMKDLQDIHNGKLIFCVGAGPSLHFITEEQVKQIIQFPIICVNSAILKFAKYDCKDLYFLSDDIGVKNWNYYMDILPKINCKYLLYYDKLKDNANHLNQEKICWFKHKSWYSPEKNYYNPDGLVMTKSEPIIGSRNSLGSTINVAYIMGGTPVLLGCDSCYYQNKRYYWQFKGEKRAFRLDNVPVYSVPNKGIRDGQPIDNHSLDFIHYFEALSKQCEKQNIKILNASGGILKCFEKVKLEDIIK